MKTAFVLSFIFFACILVIFCFSSVNADESIDYAVITTSDYTDSFVNLTSWKQTRGSWTERENITCHIELLSNITSNSSFWEGGYWDTNDSVHSSNDTQSQIRNYINYTYNNHSTRYVLLGGNPTIIPIRSWNIGYGNTAKSDTYYMKILDNDWDTYHFDIAVGRVPFSTQSQLDIWINKVLTYENTTDANWSKTGILTGMHGWNYEYITELSKELYDWQIIKASYNHVTGSAIDLDVDKYSPQFVSYTAGHGPVDTGGTIGNSGSFLYPWISINSGCGSGDYDSLTTWGDIFTESDNKMFHIAPECTTAGDLAVFNEQFVKNMTRPNTGNLGFSIGDSFINAMNTYNDNYIYDMNIFACPESQVYIDSSDGLSAQINGNDSMGTKWNDGYAWYGQGGGTGSYHLTPYWKDGSLIGTANGTSFDHYTLRLGWWDISNYTFTYTTSPYEIRDLKLSSPGDGFPTNWQDDCFDYNGSLEVNDSSLGVLNYSKVNATDKTIYVVEVKVFDASGNYETDFRYMMGFGYATGIVKYDNGTEVPVGTQVNISFDHAWNDTDRTVLTYLYDGHTGYFSCNLWDMTPEPMRRSAGGTPSVSAQMNNITIECLGDSTVEAFYLSEQIGWIATPGIYNITFYSSPTISSITETGITTSSAYVNFDVDVEGTNNIVEYSEHSDLASSYFTSWQNSSSTSFSFQITGLSPHKTYYYQIYSENQGDSTKNDTSSIGSFTTDNNAPQILNENPSDGAVDEPIERISLAVYVQDADGESFTWTIETSPDIGSSGDSGYNGTKDCMISGLDFSVTYTWWVNVTDGGTWTNESYTFTIRDNTAPNITSPNINDTIVNDLPVDNFNISIDDAEDDFMTIYFYTNASGDWVIFNESGYSINCDFCVYSSDNTSWVDSYDTKYWWSANVTDGYYWTNETYSFTTRFNNPPNVTVTLPSNNTNDWDITLDRVIATINDTDGDVFDWTIEIEGIAGTSSGNDASNGSQQKLIVSDLDYSTTYTWWVNVTDGFASGSYWFNFTTKDNVAPVINGELPENNTDDLPSILKVNISDYEMMSWTIECSNGDNNSGNSATGTISMNVITTLELNSTYTWWVNVTDGFTWTNTSYNFTTPVLLLKIGYYSEGYTVRTIVTFALILLAVFTLVVAGFYVTHASKGDDDDGYIS